MCTHSDSLHTPNGAFDMRARTHEPPLGCMQGKPCVLGKVFLHHFTHRKKQKTNRNDDAQLAVKPVTSSSRVSVASSRVSVASCTITMDNRHHLIGCSGQSSL